jgi:hypothetical protein
MLKCVYFPDDCTTHIVAKRVAQTLVAGLLILMMAA